jgi:hypothetical protein
MAGLSKTVATSGMTEAGVQAISADETEVDARVNALAPGIADTQITAANLLTEAEADALYEPVGGGGGGVSNDVFSIINQYSYGAAFVLNRSTAFSNTSNPNHSNVSSSTDYLQVVGVGTMLDLACSAAVDGIATTRETYNGFAADGAHGVSWIVGTESDAVLTWCRLGLVLRWKVNALTSSGFEGLQLADPKSSTSEPHVSIRLSSDGSQGTTWEVIHNDGSATSTVVDTGVAFVKGKNYELGFLVDGGVRIHWAIREAGVEDATITSGLLTTNIPPASSRGQHTYAGLCAHTTGVSGRKVLLGLKKLATKSSPWGATL